MTVRDYAHSAYYVLTTIMVIGFFLRIIWIHETPPGLNSDELLKAYDGSSILFTGKDHHGNEFPIFFQQSGEYSPPLYIYFSGIFSYSLGINSLSVRLPSIILGTLSILFTFCFVRQISNTAIALIASMLVVFSPWNIFYSRLGWEAILQPPLQLVALWHFFYWRNNKNLTAIIIASIAFALCFYAYPTERLFIPFVMVVLVLLSHNSLISNWKQTVIAFIIFFVLLIPTIHMYFYHHEQMQARWMFLSVFNHADGFLIFFQQWLQHISPLFLFISGAGFGMLGGMALLVLLPFFYCGLWICIRRHNASDLLLIAWFLLYAIPASMTFDRYDPNSMPNSLRTTCGMPILEIISAIGIHYCYQIIKSSKNKSWFKNILSTLIIINASIVLYDYYFNYADRTNLSSHYGFNKLIEYTESQKLKYDRVIISHKIGLHPISIASFSIPFPRPFSHLDYPKYVLPFYHYVPTYHEWGSEEYDRFGIINRWYYQGEGKLLLAAKAGEIQGETPIHVISYPNEEPAYEFYVVNR